MHTHITQHKDIVGSWCRQTLFRTFLLRDLEDQRALCRIPTIARGPEAYYNISLVPRKLSFINVARWEWLGDKVTQKPT